MTNEELIKLAFEAREKAYAPYSHWKVGAALLTKDGKVYEGANIENCCYTSTVCAERTAFFQAVLDGCFDFEKIAIVGGDEVKGCLDYCSPCGVCRQVMTEFCKPDFKVIIAKNEKEYKEYPLKQMIPEAKFMAAGDTYGNKISNGK